MPEPLVFQPAIPRFSGPAAKNASPPYRLMLSYEGMYQGKPGVAAKQIQTAINTFAQTDRIPANVTVSAKVYGPGYEVTRQAITRLSQAPQKPFSITAAYSLPHKAAQAAEVVRLLQEGAQQQLPAYLKQAYPSTFDVRA
ncbi:MAG: hypothetical protein KC475_11075 [Cyanobacteria bacterium HKST-UBA03]|nr:hypothetical protein [Cyanobacteria bacterium HKST-UBA03]